jgi:hypothetical protein
MRRGTRGRWPPPPTEKKEFFLKGLFTQTDMHTVRHI